MRNTTLADTLISSAVQHSPYVYTLMAISNRLHVPPTPLSFDILEKLRECMYYAVLQTMSSE